jgi:cell division protein FtsI/penicillin-binding protein 2
MSQPASANWRKTMRTRVWVVAAVVMVWAVGIEARLAWLQVVQRDELATWAARQQRRTVAIPGKRGDILDRHGRILALSVDGDAISAVPSALDNPARAAESLCRVLEGCTDKERVQILQRFQLKREFVYVRRQASAQDARKVTALNLPGIAINKEPRRYYPSGALGAHLLGWVSTENAGASGIELAYDSKIRGRDGTVVIDIDARRHVFGRVERPSTTGATLELTIDSYLQHVTERELHQAVVDSRAASGMAIILDPRTGEILALANEPTFDPNEPLRGDLDSRRNRAVQDVYEPGSTFKLVTASAALEEHVATPAEMFDASAGFIRIGSRQVNDTANHGVLSFTDVIVESSNVGAIKIGQRLGPERLGRYVRRFGFGTRLCPDTPGENAGIVWNAATWSDSTMASVSMGYEIGVTPLQMVTAAAAVGNGGRVVQPHAVRARLDGADRTEVGVREMPRAISTETAATLVGIMEQVVARGTGRAAAIPGYTVAGKTGTTAKLVGRQYSKRDYNASFVGLVPSRNPAFSIVVVIDSPHAGHIFGGDVAAPVFKRIAEAALQHYGIPPTINPAPPIVVLAGGAAGGDIPALKTAVPFGGFTQVGTAKEPPTVPDLRGLAAREAIRRLAIVGLLANLRGDGIVIDQDPGPGVPLERGRTCRLWLERVSTPFNPLSPQQ